MYMLKLNDMRHAHYEDLTLVCIGETKQELLDFIEREKVECYEDEGMNSYGSTTFSKSFRKGGSLEWFNLPSPSLEEFQFVDLGSEADYALREMERAKESYREFVARTPRAKDL